MIHKHGLMTGITEEVKGSMLPAVASGLCTVKKNVTKFLLRF
jgi:hypothetical protein